MYFLGKKPARSGAIRFGFSQFFSTPDLPEPPLVFGRPDLIASWGDLGNDRCGDCCWAGAAHETMLWRAWVGASIPAFTDTSVVADYAKATGYDGTDASDQGTDMQAGASYRRKTGIVDAAETVHKVDAYVSLPPGDLEQLAVASYLFGAVGVGLELPLSALDQFSNGEPWAPVSGSTIEGGHYVPCVGRNSHGNFLVVTWGQLHAATPAFLAQYMDEGAAYLSFEQLQGTINPRHFDETGLKKALAEL
jgi:hypothetical protein